MRITSILAYESLKKSLTTKQKIVLDCLIQSAKTNKQISQTLKKPINEITPRVGELVKIGCVVDLGRIRDSSTGRLCTLWGVNESKIEKKSLTVEYFYRG